MFWTFVFFIILAALIWFAHGIWKIGAISVGAPIQPRSQFALLLIDLQTAFWEAGTYDDATKSAAKQSILAEIKTAKANDVPVIGIRHEWSIPSTKAVAKLLGKGLAIEGTPGTELIKPLDDLADHTMIKRVQDAFETNELDELLAQLNVGKIRIVGLDANHCVAKTALAARQRGYEVEIIRQGVLAADTKKAAGTFEMLQEKQIAIR